MYITIRKLAMLQLQMVTSSLGARFWGFHGSEDSCRVIVICDAGRIGAFQRSTLHPSSE
jgi:hypothetical protein